MNTEWLWKLSTSFIFKGLDGLECQDFLCWKSHLSTPSAEGFLLQFPACPGAGSMPPSTISVT